MREKKVDMGENVQPKHCAKRQFSISEIHVCRFGGGRAKSSIFKKLGKHWLGFLHLKLECGATLNAPEVTRVKKVDMGENLSPTHCPNRQFSTSEIHVCRFGGGLKVASLKSYVGFDWGFPHLKLKRGASLNARELTREKKVDMGENVQDKHCANRQFSTSEIYVCRVGGGLKVSSLKSQGSIGWVPAPET